MQKVSKCAAIHTSGQTPPTRHIRKVRTQIRDVDIENKTSGWDDSLEEEEKTKVGHVAAMSQVKKSCVHQPIHE